MDSSEVFALFEPTVREALVKMPALKAALVTAQAQAQVEAQSQGKEAEKAPLGSKASRFLQHPAVVAAAEALEAAEAKLAVVCSRTEYAHAV